MASSEPDLGLLPEKRLDLAIQAFNSGQVASIRAASRLYEVPYTSVHNRLNGLTTRHNAQVNNRRLTSTEEKTLIQRIKLLDDNGFSPTLPFVRNMANLLLQQREPGCEVGKNWPTRWTRQHNELVAKYLRKHDYQRAKCEDPDILGKWFQLLQSTISKYGIVTEDIYNFDETGFQMGDISTTKALTQTQPSRSKQPRGSGRVKSGRPPVSQPGNQHWVTVIEGINASGWAVPPTIIFEDNAHQSTRYHTTEIPDDWVIGVSGNGWTTDSLGYKWLVDVFDKHTRDSVVGKHRLLLLDGHKSHFTVEFDQYCRDNSIIYLCYPPHSTDRLQPLDVGLFSPLKGTYNRLVQEMAGLGINHIDKPDFLRLLYQARHTTFTSENIKSAFQAVGIIPFNPQEVLSRPKVRTPSPSQQSQNPGNHSVVKTVYNTIDLQTRIPVIQQRHIQDIRSGLGLDLGLGFEPILNPGLTQAIEYIIKAWILILHENTLLREENNRLRAENQIRSKKKQARRFYIARGGLLTVGEGRRLALEKHARMAKPASRRLCGNCRLPGHTRRKCPGIQDSIHVII
jgi:hypothetical protein